MPVRRKSRRYLRIWVMGGTRFVSEEVSDAVQKGTINLLGIQGLSLVEPLFIEFDEDAQIGTLRCNSSHLREMRAALALITNIGESAAAIHVEGVSGTIKALKSK